MKNEEVVSPACSKIQLAGKCLTIIGNMARRAVRSQDPGHMGYVLQELSQVLLERTGCEERLFEPVSVDEIGDLAALYEELDFADGGSQSMAAEARQKARCRGFGPAGG